jgi:hypothetical protein
MNEDLAIRKQTALNEQYELARETLESIPYQDTHQGLQHCYLTIANFHISRGILSYFIRGERDNLKQDFFTASLLNLKSITIASSPSRLMLKDLLFAMLTDSHELIRKFSIVAPEEGEQTENSSRSSTVLMFQSAMTGDYELLKTIVDRQRGETREKRKATVPQLDFFDLLLRRDSEKLRALIKDHAQSRSNDVLLEEFVSTQATLELKICWAWGIPIELNEPLIPMDLMKVEPLPSYEYEYEFLRPGYTAPKVGLIDRMIFRFNEKRKTRRMINRLSSQ